MLLGYCLAGKLYFIAVPGVDESAYVKAAFLAALVKGEASSSLISAEEAVQMRLHRTIARVCLDMDICVTYYKLYNV